ncbi:MULTISPECIES: hypothetical protein [unclassified Microbacterium]|uniref:hypothetical protein n=1 Tax=unclassified Microbacterium TaxID=2609290 RepID=UPI0038655B4F
MADGEADRHSRRRVAVWIASLVLLLALLWLILTSGVLAVIFDPDDERMAVSRPGIITVEQ